MRVAVEAYADGSDVIYVYDGGVKERWSGGTRTWRNNNPGNVRFVPANTWQGLIGEAGGFCVFAGPEWGRRAGRLVWTAYAAQGLTLAEGIGRYAPAGENDTAGYLADVTTWTGLGADASLAALGAAEMDALAQAVFRKEGWREGAIASV